MDWLHICEANLLIDAEVVNEFGGIFLRNNLRQTLVIDLAFYAGFRTIEWGEWRYIERTGSDHKAIAFEAILEHEQAPMETLRPLFHYKKADWAQFDYHLQHNQLARSIIRRARRAIREEELE